MPRDVNPVDAAVSASGHHSMPVGVRATKFDPIRTVPALPPGALLSLGWLTAGVLVMILIGSLIPFTFDLPLGADRAARGLSLIGWPATPFEDLVANFVSYAPLGALLYMIFASVTRSSVSAALAAWALALALSTLIESLQTMMPARVASWMDVCMNGLGAAAGVAAGQLAVAATAILPRLGRWPGCRSCTLSATAVACGLVLYHLIPFDFVTSTADLQKSLGQSRLWPFIPGSLGAGVSSRALIGWFGVAGQFAVLGILCMRCKGAAGITLRSSACRSLCCVSLVAAIVEVSHIFVASHAFDTLDWLAATTGGSIGIAIAAWSRRCERGISLRTLAGAALLCEVLYLALASAWPFDLGWRHADFDRLARLPFAATLSRPFAPAMGELLTALVSYAVLAVLARVVLQGISIPARSAAVLTTAVGTACICQMLELLSPSRSPDLTHAALALLVAVPIALWPAQRASMGAPALSCPADH
jgi:VanZ family protein